MSHTPGPWEVVSMGNGESEVLANGPNRDDVASVCMVAGGLGHVISDNRDYESEANASLIAAAPELLAALEDLLDQLDSIGIPDWHGAEGLCLEQSMSAIKKAKSAIKKARVG